MQRAGSGELAHAGLQVVEGLSYKDQEDEVGQKEGSASILVGQVGEPPNVANSDLEEKDKILKVIKASAECQGLAYQSILRA